MSNQQRRADVPLGNPPASVIGGLPRGNAPRIAEIMAIATQRPQLLHLRPRRPAGISGFGLSLACAPHERRCDSEINRRALSLSDAGLASIGALMCQTDRVSSGMQDAADRGDRLGLNVEKCLGWPFLFPSGARAAPPMSGIHR